MATTHSETEILKQVVKKRNFQQAYDLLSKKGQSHAKDLSSKQKQEDRQNQLKQATRLWQAMSRSIRSQMDEGRIVDTLYYGSFAKASSVSGDSNATNWVYCPGPKAILKLVENEDNLADFAQPLLDEKLTTLSMGSLAEQCGMTVETVTGILSGIRDEIVDLVVVKKQNAALNLGFGTLNLRAGGTVEFKSNVGASNLAIEVDFEKTPLSPERMDRFTSADKKSTFSQKRQSETFSKQSNAERSLNFMQQRQASQGVNRSDIKSATSKNAPSHTSENPMRLNSDRKSGSANDLAPVRNKNKLVFLNTFLKDQISSATGEMNNHHRRAASSQGQKKANQIIEETAKMRSQGVCQEEMMDYVKNATAHYGTVFKTRSNNLSKIKVSDKDKAEDAEGARQIAVNYSGDTDLIFLNNRMTHTNKVGGYRRNQQSIDVAATNSLSQTRTPLKPAALIQSTTSAANDGQQREMVRTIQKALNRKQISPAYHTNMPVFLRSEGPFAMYDHSLRHIDQHTSDKSPTVVDQAAMQALHRYENELVRLKQLREAEKAQFINSIEHQKHQLREAQAQRGVNQKQNQEFINLQMDWARQKRADDKHHNKQYYKPHFGPEETQEIIQQMRDTEQSKINWQYNSLRNQLQDQNEAANQKRNIEADLDHQRLNDTLAIQKAENDKLKYKEMASKANMRQAWLEQMAYKQAHKQTDNFFK